MPLISDENVDCVVAVLLYRSCRLLVDELPAVLAPILNFPYDPSEASWIRQEWDAHQVRYPHIHTMVCSMTWCLVVLTMLTMYFSAYASPFSSLLPLSYLTESWKLEGGAAEGGPHRRLIGPSFRLSPVRAACCH